MVLTSPTLSHLDPQYQKSFTNYSSKANDSHTQSTNDMNEKTDGMSTKISTELLKEEKHLNPQTSKKLLQYT
ncbi:unnamed protein product, partial [Didymodactylos carnosus]